MTWSDWTRTNLPHARTKPSHSYDTGQTRAQIESQPLANFFYFLPST